MKRQAILFRHSEQQRRIYEKQNVIFGLAPRIQEITKKKVIFGLDPKIQAVQILGSSQRMTRKTI